MARVEAIWVKRVARGPMDSRDEATMVAGRGLEGSADQGGKRQVTLIDAAAWARAESDLGRAVDPALRRANLMLRGLDLRGTRGRVLRIGPCRILVHGETRPCRRLDEECPGLEAALDPEWRGGIYGEILTGGRVAPGDPAAWEVGEGSPPPDP